MRSSIWYSRNMDPKIKNKKTSDLSHRPGGAILLLLFALVLFFGVVFTFLNYGIQPQEAISTTEVTSTGENTVESSLIATDTVPVSTTTLTFEPTTTLTPTHSRIPFTGILFPGVSRGDLHMHTECSDGQSYYEEMVQGALAQGFTFIAITDHHWCPDLLETCRTETRILCIPGVEFSGVNHIVALNIQTPFYDDLPIAEQVRQIHEQGGLAIAAHPFLPGYVYSADDLLNSGFDAMECDVAGSGNPGFDISSMRCVWSSDAHNVSKLGTPGTYMVCDVLIRNFEELRAAILGGHCRPGME